MSLVTLTLLASAIAHAQTTVADGARIAAAAEALRIASNVERMESLDAPASRKSQLAARTALADYRSALGSVPVAELGPPWARERIQVDGKQVEISTLIGKLKQLAEGRLTPSRHDLALNFVPTEDNAVEVLAGREKFWPRLLEDIRRARTSIHIHIFGMQWDEWGKEVAELLAAKSRDGVRVRIIADQIGARMNKGFSFNKKFSWKHPPGEAMFQFYDQAGVEYAFYASKLLKDKGFHADHRKYFIIDGQISHNTGFTLEEHMRRIEFDVGIRARGSVVRQLQASWLINWAKLGKKLDTKDWPSLQAKYLPEPEEKGEAELKATLNVPWEQHRITESHHDAIRGASRRIWIVDPYVINRHYVDLLIAAAKRGVEIRVVTPINPENKINSKLMAALNYAMREAGIDTQLYLAPDKIGKSHAKGILVDDWISFGSCNRDTMALRHNFEQNLESSSPSVVRQIEEEVFAHLFAHSIPNEVPPGLEPKLRGRAWQLIREVLTIFVTDPT